MSISAEHSLYMYIDKQRPEATLAFFYIKKAKRNEREREREREKRSVVA
jgi:hypothetical protein